ncbi:MAG: hypothetical protein DRH90_21635 [Deltaproteobacteria bacterium]|nr:MAG: hypothetical protein DRH90_21635 [Deltaproteobacteria bacterium]RLC14330.1 MAG: hypothetical protein DRI24_13695 [Deltaproteobacteria bacterium]
MNNMIKIVEKIIRGVFKGSVFPLLFMMMLVAGDVILRNIFNATIPDTYEFNSMFLIVLISMALPLTTHEKGHVSVTLIHQKFGRGLKTICDVITLSIGAVVFAIMSVEMVDRALYSMRSDVRLGYLRFPEYPFRFVFAVGCCLTSAALLLLLIETLLSWHKKQTV